MEDTLELTNLPRPLLITPCDPVPDVKKLLASEFTYASRSFFLSEHSIPIEEMHRASTVLIPVL